MLFESRCAVAGCHTARDMAATWILASAGIFARLVGQPAHGGPGLLIDPGGSPQDSVLYLKLTPNPPFGLRMPATGESLDDASMACVASWIRSRAALGDGGVAEEGPPSSEGPSDAYATDAPTTVEGDDSSDQADATGGPDGSGNGPLDGASPATFTRVYAVIQANCLPCHTSGTGLTQGLFDMSTKANAYKNLVGAHAVGSACGKGGYTRVVAGNLAESLFYAKLFPNPPCGVQMPHGAAPLAASTLAEIAGWIEGGAPND